MTLREAIRLYAVVDGTVLIEGETGVGKELVARAVHEESRRSAGGFSSVDCGALAESLFESELFGHERGAFTGAFGARRGLVAAASGGTLFLDEIENLSLGQQAKILRLVQEREFRALGSERVRRVDLRLVVATNQSLAELVGRGLFRADLFYRLDVLRIAVPALRDRLEDLPDLLAVLAARNIGPPGSTGSPRLAPSAVGPTPHELASLCRRTWPGNVRELANLAERAAVLSLAMGWARAWSVAIGGHRVPSITGLPKDSSGAFPTAPAAATKGEPDIGSAGEADRLRSALDRHRWKREAAARELGISRVTLWRRMRRCGLDEGA